MQSDLPVPGSAEDRDITRFEDAPFPGIYEVLSAVNAEAGVEGLTPYRYDIGVLASGEVTYKIRVKESEDSVSGVIAL